MLLAGPVRLRARSPMADVVCRQPSNLVGDVDVLSMLMWNTMSVALPNCAVLQSMGTMPELAERLSRLLSKEACSLHAARSRPAATPSQSSP